MQTIEVLKQIRERNIEIARWENELDKYVDLYNYNHIIENYTFGAKSEAYFLSRDKEQHEQIRLWWLNKSELSEEIESCEIIEVDDREYRSRLLITFK